MKLSLTTYGFSLLEVLIVLLVLIPILSSFMYFVGQSSQTSYKTRQQDHCFTIKDTLKYYLQEKADLEPQKTTYLYASSTENTPPSINEKLLDHSPNTLLWAIQLTHSPDDFNGYFYVQIHTINPLNKKIEEPAIYSFPLCLTQKKDSL